MGAALRAKGLVTLAREVGWGSYSHDVLDPLTKKSVNMKHDDDKESGGMYRLDTRTNLFEQVKSKVTGGEYAVCALICYIRVLYCMRTSFSRNLLIYNTHRQS